MPRSSRKPKKRQFYGNRWTDKAFGTVDNDGQCEESSTSAKKLKLQADTAPSSASTGYRFVDIGRVVDLVWSALQTLQKPWMQDSDGNSCGIGLIPKFYMCLW